jgi:vitamin B12 transporter
MFSQIAVALRSLRCAGHSFLRVVALLLSACVCVPAFAQNAQPAGADQPTVLPSISVMQAPPSPLSRPTTQGSGNAVVVSPTTTPTPSDQSGSSVTVITANDIETQQLRTVPDALATVPGLNVVQTGGPGGQTSVFIRGTNSNHVKVLVDGVDMSDPSNPNDAFDFGQLLTGDIERIEILRGPQSGLYGSDAIGGVIAITTKQGSGPPKVTASLEGGSFGTFNQRVGLSGSQADFNYAFNVQHFQSASTPVTPLNLLAPGEQRINDFYDNWTYSTKLGAKLSDTWAVNVVARYTDSRLGTTGEDFIDFAFPAPEALQSTQVDHQFYGRAEAVWSPSDQIKNFFGVNYTDSWSWFFNPNADSGTTPAVFPPSTNLGTRTKYDYRGEFQVAPGQVLVLGAEDQNETLRTDSTSFFDPSTASNVFFLTSAERKSDAGWVQLQNQLTKQFSIVSNIRYDDYEDFGDHTTWRVAPVFIVPDIDTKLKASYGTGFKAPPLSELFVNFPGQFIANPNLKPEQSQGWDAGFEQPIANDRFRFGATYFRNDVTDLIQGAPSSTPGVGTVVNVDRASMYGVEAFASWNVNRFLNLRTDYTYTIAKDDLTGEELLRRPKNKASLTANWKPIDHLTFSSTLLYVSSWLDEDRSFSFEEYAAPFTTVNLAAEYAATDSVTYFARINNLFNKQYEDPIGFERPGFGIFGGVKLTFGGAPPNGTTSATSSPVATTSPFGTTPQPGATGRIVEPQ